MFHQTLALFCADIVFYCFTCLIRSLFIRDFDDLQFTVAAQPLAVFGDSVS